MAFFNRMRPGNKTEIKQKKFSGDLQCSEVTKRDATGAVASQTSEVSTTSMFEGLSVMNHPEKARGNELQDKRATRGASLSTAADSTSESESCFSFLQDEFKDDAVDSSVEESDASTSSAFSFLCESVPDHDAVEEPQCVKRTRKKIVRPGYANSQERETSSQIAQTSEYAEIPETVTTVLDNSSTIRLEIQNEIPTTNAKLLSEENLTLTMASTSEQSYGDDKKDDDDKRDSVLLNYLDIDTVDDDKSDIEDSDTVCESQLELSEKACEEIETEPSLSPMVNESFIVTPTPGQDLVAVMCHTTGYDDGHTPDNANYQVNLSEEEEFGLSYDTTMSRHRHIRSEYDAIVRDRSTLLDECRSVVEQCEALEGKITSLQTAQKNAIVTEDFDQADELGLEMKRATDEMDRLKAYHPLQDHRLELHCSSLRTFQATSGSQLPLLRKDYESLEEKQSTMQKELQKQMDREWSKRKHVWEEQTKNFERSLQHVRLDLDHFKEAEGLLVSSMEQDTRDLHVKKGDLIKKRSEIQGDIALLEAKLNALKKDEQQCTSDLDDIQCEIDAVLADYSPRREQIRNECQALGLQEKTYRQRLEQLAQEGEELTSSKESSVDASNRLAEFLRKLESELSAIDEFQSEINAATSDDTVIPRLDLVVEKDDDCTSVEENIKSCESTVDLFTNKIVQLQGKRTSLRNQTKEDSALLDDINNTKTLAVKARNFKEAKQLSDEVKVLQQKLDKDKESLESCSKDMELARDNLAESRAAHIDLQKEFEELQRNRDLLIIEKLRNAIAILNGSSLSSERHHWLHEFITVEISTCQLQLMKLCHKHNLEAKLQNPPSPADNDDDPASVEGTEQDVQNDDQTEEDCDETKLLSMKKEIEELETQLQDAIDAEDFDLADEINSKILKLQKHYQD